MSSVRRYDAVTVVRDGDGYVLGRRDGSEFVAVPEIGGQVMLWLQDGEPVEVVAARAGEQAGQEVDVEDFLTTLEEAGVLTEQEVDERPLFGRRAGRILFGPVALRILAVVVLAGLVLLVTDPALRPTYHDGVPFATPLFSLMTVMTTSMVLTIMHELAHKIAAAGLGVYGRISFGRRLFFIVAQTDLTGLWALPRRRRLVPLAAGLLVDSTVAATLIILQACVVLPPEVLVIVRLAVLLKVGGIVAQSAVYLRTDFYALFLVATGSRNLWALKGALARRLVRRATRADEETIAAATRREINWARFYLALYLPGILVATWYYLRFTLPATIKLVRLALAAIADSGLSLTGAGAVLALLLILVPASLGLFGALRAGVGVIRRNTLQVSGGVPGGPRSAQAPVLRSGG